MSRVFVTEADDFDNNFDYHQSAEDIARNSHAYDDELDTRDYQTHRRFDSAGIAHVNDYGIGGASSGRTINIMAFNLHPPDSEPRWSNQKKKNRRGRYDGSSDDDGSMVRISQRAEEIQRRKEHEAEEQRKCYTSIVNVWKKQAEATATTKPKKHKREQRATTTTSTVASSDPEEFELAKRLSVMSAREIWSCEIPRRRRTVSRPAYVHRVTELGEAASAPLTHDLGESERQEWAQRLCCFWLQRRRLRKDHIEYMGAVTRWSLWIARARVSNSRPSRGLPLVHTLLEQHGWLLADPISENPSQSNELTVSMWLDCMTRLLEQMRHHGPRSLGRLRLVCETLDVAACEFVDRLHQADHPVYRSENAARAMMTFARDAELLLGSALGCMRVRDELLGSPPLDEPQLTGETVREATRNVWLWAIGLATQPRLTALVTQAFRRRMYACLLRPDEHERFESERQQTRATAVNVLGTYRQHTLDRANTWRTLHNQNPIGDVLNELLNGRCHAAVLLGERGRLAPPNDYVDHFERLAMDVVLRYYFSFETGHDVFDRYMLDETRVPLEFHAADGHRRPRMLRLFNCTETCVNGCVLRLAETGHESAAELNSTARAFVAWLHAMCMHGHTNGLLDEHHHVWALYEQLVPCEQESDRRERARRRRAAEKALGTEMV